MIMMAQSMLRVSVPHPGGVALIPPLSPQLHLFEADRRKTGRNFMRGVPSRFLIGTACRVQRSERNGILSLGMRKEAMKHREVDVGIQ